MAQQSPGPANELREGLGAFRRKKIGDGGCFENVGSTKLFDLGMRLSGHDAEVPFYKVSQFYRFWPAQHFSYDLGCLAGPLERRGIDGSEMQAGMFNFLGQFTGLVNAPGG